MQVRYYHTILFGLFLVVNCILPSCNTDEGKNAVYHIANNEDTIKLPILIWHVKSDAPFFDGIYTPLYGQLDLREVYAIGRDDTLDFDKSNKTELRCTIKSDGYIDVYLEAKSSMPASFILNDDTLCRREIDGINLYPMRLRKGKNKLLAVVTPIGDDLSFETTVYDSLSVAQLYAEQQSCCIIYPQISRHTKRITLSNAHQNVLSAPVSLTFKDVKGDTVSRIKLERDSMRYHVEALQENHSYICCMNIGNTVVRQPILCGKGDIELEKFTSLRDSLPKGHPRLDEVDQVLYRLRFLLNHPSRYEDEWWWQYKITPLTYQLEHIFAHLDGTYGDTDTEFNVKFITYQSAQDDSLQRYLLVTPNHIKQEAPMPLVVIIRPFCENRHHFFASPQLARQWALNIVQGLANHYGFIVMMPEARMLQSEDLTPKAEREVSLALADVKKHYRIDENRIYLHANCSGGYRALKYAEANPDIFAAIGLYAPMYKVDYTSEWSKKHTAKSLIGRLKGIPLMIHYDPMDGHSTPDQFKELIDDCHEYDIPLTLSVKRNSGKFYNVVIAGFEAFEFFGNKTNRH